MNNKEQYPSFNKENPFRVPENYFEELPEKIFENILASEKTPVRIKPVFGLKKSLAIAAAIAGLIFLTYSGYYLINKSDNDQNQIAYINDTTDAEYSFVDENNIVDAISNVISENEEVEGDDIVNYLVEDDIDENLIAEAY